MFFGLPSVQKACGNHLETIFENIEKSDFSILGGNVENFDFENFDFFLISPHKKKENRFHHFIFSTELLLRLNLYLCCYKNIFRAPTSSGDLTVGVLGVV